MKNLRIPFIALIAAIFAINVTVALNTMQHKKVPKTECSFNKGSSDIPNIELQSIDQFYWAPTAVEKIEVAPGEMANNINVNKNPFCIFDSDTPCSGSGNHVNNYLRINAPFSRNKTYFVWDHGSNNMNYNHRYFVPKRLTAKRC